MTTEADNFSYFFACHKVDDQLKVFIARNNVVVINYEL